MSKRTNIDFSKHELTEIRQPGLLIHDLKIPDMFLNRVQFINTRGIMAVTGDFGNWIFDREFHPSAEGNVDDPGYWCQKLKMASTQVPGGYSAGETEKEIRRLRTEEEDLSEAEREYLNGCLIHVMDELDYTYYAYRENVGRFEDGECVPFQKERNPWLETIFDAFEEICGRIKAGSPITKTENLV